jgi:hypothetical protein
VISYAEFLNAGLMMHRSAAETLALKALGHLAADEEFFPQFLRISGLELDDLRQRAGEPELLAAVVDFLLSEEKLCESFLTAEQLRIQELLAARRALPGMALE